MNKMSIMMAAGEVPVGTGYAEQHGISQSGMMCFASSSDDELTDSGDDVNDALSSMPASTHATLIKSLSDVIVFGTNGCNEMGTYQHVRID